MAKTDRLEYLFQHYLDKTCTEAERQEFFELAGDPACADQLYALSEKYAVPEQPLQFIDETVGKDILHAIFTSFENELQPESRPNRRLPIRLPFRLPILPPAWFRAAAILILLIGAGGYFYFQKSRKTQLITSHSVPVEMKEELLPGSKGAILTLGDGREIVLDNQKDGLVTNMGGIQIMLKNGLLSYSGPSTPTTPDSHPASPYSDAAKPLSHSADSSLAYNRITTPRGRQFQVRLPDGTRVWLNAASSLSYPVTFQGKERRVRLMGEGYFEVAKNNAMPFRLTAGGVEVDVLGTHFNVTSYEEDGQTKTTLLEGAVRVVKGNSKINLKPGQQAGWEDGKKTLVIQKADIEQAIAWKNGFFIFNGATISSILTQLSRWYDFDVQLQGDVGNKRFSGTIGNDTKIEKVLDMLSLTKEVSFKREGRTIIARP